MAIAAAQLMVMIGADTRSAEQNIRSVGGMITGFGEKAQRAGLMMSALVTTPLTLIGKDAIGQVADYDGAMNVLQATSNATGAEMDLLRQKSMALGADMTLPGTSAADAAEAMLELSKSGMSVNDVLAASRGVIQMSAAGQLGNARAAEIASNALNAFGLEGKEATRVADLLAASANASSADVADMADGMQMASAVFAAAGTPIEDLVTELALMANAGIKGSDAGTSLKQMMLSLQAPTKKAAETMQELGVNVYDAQGNMLSQGEIIGQFQSKLSGLTQEQRNAALATIFGSDAVRAANVVMMGGVGTFERMKTAVSEQGAAAKLAGAQMGGLKGAFENLKSAVETAELAAVQPFQQDIEALTGAMAEAIATFSGWPEWARKATVAMGGVTAATGPMVAGVGAMSQAIGNTSQGLAQLPTFCGEAAAGMQLMKQGFGAMEVASLGGGAAFAALVPPILAVTAALAASALVVAAWNENITKMNAAGRDAVGGAYADMFGKMTKDGANATEVVNTFNGAMKRQNDEFAKARAASPAGYFIDQAGTTKAAFDQLNIALSKTPQGYREYKSSLEGAAKSNGLFINSQGDLYRKTELGAYQLVEANFVLTEQEFNTAQGADELGESLGRSKEALDALMGPARKAANELAGTGEAAMASKKAVLENKEIYDLLSTSMKEAGWEGENIEDVSRKVSVSLGDTSEAGFQMWNDMKLASDALAYHVIEMEQYQIYAKQAKDGTLELSGASRDAMEAAVAHAKAVREEEAAARDASLAYWDMAESLKGAGQAQIAKSFLGGLAEKMKDKENPLDPALYDAAMGSLGVKYGFVTRESMEMAKALPILNNYYVVGRIGAENLSGAMQMLSAQAAVGAVNWDEVLKKYGQTPAVMQGVQSAANTAQQSMGQLGQSTGVAVQEMAQNISGENLSSVGTQAGQGLAGGIKTEVDKIPATTATTVMQMKQPFESTDWVGLGSGIGFEVAAGLRAATPAAVAAANEMAGKIQSILDSISVDVGDAEIGTTGISGGVDTSTAGERRASGGPIVRGQRYLAGESVFTRPEIFVAGQSGYMLTRQDAQAALAMAAGGGSQGGGEQRTNVYGNVTIVVQGAADVNELFQQLKG